MDVRSFHGIDFYGGHHRQENWGYEEESQTGSTLNTDRETGTTCSCLSGVSQELCGAFTDKRKVGSFRLAVCSKSTYNSCE